MFRTAKKWALAVTLTALMQVTIVCDSRGMAEFFDDLDFQVYYDDCHCDYWDCRHHDRWSDCDDECFFDFDWWW